MPNRLVKMIWGLSVKPVLETLPDSKYQEFRRHVLNLVSFAGITNSKQAMDKRIVALFNNKRNGTFIEVGAADGLDQSNTLLLERKLGWSGLLVEPVKDQYEYCKSVRPHSVVERFILTSFEDTDTHKEINATALGSRVEENVMTPTLSERQIYDYQKQNPQRSLEKVAACTLDSLLDKHGIKHVDIFSLDVEGFEEIVLNGFSGENCQIDYLLVEAQNHEKFQEYAEGRGWKFIEAWTDGDFLYQLKA